MMYSEQHWLQFVNAEIETLSGVFSGSLIGGLCVFWPSMATRFYRPLFGRFTWIALKVFGYSGLGWSVFSLLVLTTHIVGRISN
jgi:hypothetical protein